MWEDEAAAGSRSSTDLGGRDPAPVPTPTAPERRYVVPFDSAVYRKLTPDSDSARNIPAPTPALEVVQETREQELDRATEAALQQLRDEILPEAESAVEEWKEKYTATKAALGFVENQYLAVIAERDALKRENERLRAQLDEKAESG